MSAPIDNKYPIPGYDGYYLELGVNTYVYRKIGNRALFKMLKKASIDKEESVKITTHSRNERRYVPVRTLIKAVISKHFPKTMGFCVIKLNSMNCKQPLTRQRTINFILRDMPDVHIPLTPNAKGKFVMGAGMKERGMLVCDQCGNIQAVEIKICKHCNNYITQ